MTWHYFLAFAILSALLWAGGAWASWKNKSRRAYTLTGRVFKIALKSCTFFTNGIDTLDHQI